MTLLDYLGVSLNGGTPKSSILIGFSIINHPFVPIFCFFFMQELNWWRPLKPPCGTCLACCLSSDWERPGVEPGSCGSCLFNIYLDRYPPATVAKKGNCTSIDPQVAKNNFCVINVENSGTSARRSKCAKKMHENTRQSYISCIVLIRPFSNEQASPTTWQQCVRM